MPINGPPHRESRQNRIVKSSLCYANIRPGRPSPQLADRVNRALPSWPARLRFGAAFQKTCYWHLVVNRSAWLNSAIRRHSSAVWAWSVWTKAIFPWFPYRSQQARVQLQEEC